MADVSRYRRQKLCLYFVLLLLGPELQAAQAASEAAAAAGFRYRSFVNQSEDSSSSATESAWQSGGSSPSRSLLNTFAGWTWPAQTQLTFTTYSAADDVLTSPSTVQEVILMAGLVYDTVEIQAASVTFGTPHDNARIKLVTEIADRTTCHLTDYNLYDVPVGTIVQKPTGTPWSRAGAALMGTTSGPLAMARSLVTGGDKLMADTSTAINTKGSMAFMFGGIYQLCYTPDGSFGGGDDTEYKNNVLSTRLKILGIRSNCQVDRCLEQERWECYFSYKAERPSQCVFNFRQDGGRPNWGIQTGGMSKMTWSARYDSNTMTDLPICGNTDPDTGTLDTTSTGTFLKLDGISDPVDMPQVKTTYSGSSFTLGACYCPNYNTNTGLSCDTDTSLCCNFKQDYVQPFGIIYYWRLRICDLLGDSTVHYTTCTTPYMRVIPQQMFVLRVDCPPKDGCLGNNDNRIKYLEPTSVNNRPTWDSQHGCKTSILESGRALWPSPLDSRTLGGGTSTDYKAWKDKQVKLSMTLKSSLDVCYCNEACETPNNWFKIGVVETTDAFAFARKIDASSTTYTIKYVNDSGSVNFYGGITSPSAVRNPYDSNKYSGSALLNIVSFDRDLRYGIGDLKKTLEDYQGYNLATPSNFQSLMDSECQREDYNPTLVQGAWTKLDTKTYIATVPNTISNYLSFSGENQLQTLTIARAGVVAICYCAVLSAQNACLDPSQWIYSGRLTIRGPVGGQEWVFSTNIVVRLELDGWGFTENDKLRIIPETAECSDNTNSPASDTTFKVGCPQTNPPAIGEPYCQFATNTQDIALDIVTALTSTAYISGVATTETYSTLSFTKSMQNILSNKDVITIDESRIKNNGNLVGAQNDQEKFLSYQLSGNIPFQDETAFKYLVGHRVNFVTTNGVTNYQQMRIPAGFPSSGASFTFTDSQGYWKRHNKAQTPLEIKGLQEKDKLKVCWGATDTGSTKFHAQAGVVSFQNPPKMTIASINPSTRQRDAVAPVVIAFTTKASTYAEAKNAEQTLMLRFLDVGSNGNFVPRYAGDAAPDSAGPEIIPADTEVTAAQKKQRECGRLFIELWSGDSEGFPMPVGCYYSKKLRDFESTSHFRELYITFPVGNGLRQQTNYQIVVNAAIKDISLGDQLANLYSLCTSETGCARPFEVYEMGEALASVGTLATATLSDPQFNTQGFVIQRGDPVDTVLDLSDMNILQVKLRGKEENAAIQKNCILRVYMWPLTIWSLGEGSCQAECVAYHANNAKCDGPISCETESVMGGTASKNVIRLTLPADMDDITGTTQHTVKVTGLTLPQAGYFASRVGAQITRPAPDDDRPSYTTSSGWLMKKADTGQTTGRLVLSDRTGYGPLPFASNTNNILYLRLSFGATVWNNGQQDAAFVTITLPDGYTCKVPDSGAPDTTLPIFTNDLDNDGYYDNNRGSLSVDAVDGSWANSQGKVCTYTPAQYNRIYQGMVVYVKVTVDNPSAAMSKLYFKNVWTIKLSSKGANTINPNAADMNEQNFITLAEAKVLGSEYWASNAAVISPLLYETIQPTDFRRTSATYTDSQFLQIFFYTTQYVGRNGYVLLDAPDGFDFGASCLAQDLPEDYYAFRGPPSASNSALLNRFKNLATCTGMRVPHTATTYNRARIVVGGIIDVNKYYGYQVRVTHPSTYNKDQQLHWYLWTQDSNRYVLEGSQTTVKFNKLQSSSQIDFYAKAYGMYNDAFFSKFHIDIASMQPKSVTDAFTQVMIYPFTFTSETDTSLRITAPYGYKWQNDVTQFTFQIPNATLPFPSPPEFQSGDNQMVWQRVVFAANEAYGFAARIEVPDFAPATSTDAFFVEIGFNKDVISQRLMAGVIPAPRIQSFTNCVVSYGSNLLAYTNNPFEFNFAMVTTLYENDGIVIKGDSNTLGFAFTCPPTMLEGSATFPADMQCASFKAVDESPLVVLKAGLTPIIAGNYRFEMNANNPTRKILTPGNWDMGSYKAVSDYPNSPVVDKSMRATGFTINSAILSAGLVQITEKQRTQTKRNDRPNKANQLIFKFSLRNEPGSDLPLKLRAPRGFEFDEDCTSSVITEQNYVFGPNTEGLWPPDYQVWQTQFKPTSCTGDGRFATIMIPAGLAKRLEYVFRIGIVKNPPATPKWNWWTIDYNSESSDPFPSFTVWTFTETMVSPVSFAKSPTGANVAKTINPVEMKFRPYRTIPFKCPSCATGGMIRVTSPSRFEFVQTSGECNALLFKTTEGSQNAFPAANLRCSVSPTLLTKLWLEIVAGSTSVESGRDYTLIINVYNPSVTDQAQSWYLDSFDVKASANVNQDQIALDESVLPGHAIHNVLNTWTVVNFYQSQNGKAYVSDVDITMQFPDALKDNDQIKIQSPLEFDILGDADLGNCKDFRWPANTNPLPGTRTPGCECVSNQCTMTFTITEFKDPAYPQNQNIQFKIATVNPPKTPFETQDFWRVEHLRSGVIKSSHVYKSWAINPQLESVQIQLTGANQAAGTESDLVFSFLPVSDAGTIKIEALFPTEFDFGRATVPVPYTIDDRRDRGTIIINRAGVIAGRVSTIQISSVQLGVGGGQTRFNIITYRDETLTEKMDEKLEYTGGFRLPGKITVSSQDLQSKYKAERQLFPVRSLFQPRVNEQARAEFVLMFSQPATASQKLVITCLGNGAYELQTSPFVIIGKERVDASVALTPGSTTELQATLKPGRPSTEIALQADTPYTIIFNVIPVQGTNNWKFETVDGGTYPTNTNDGTAPNFKPVEQMVLTVVPTRSPPRAEIDVILNVDQKSAIVLELLVIAPPNFVFPSTGCGDLCQAGQALGSTGRRTATIASKTGEPLTKLTGLAIKVVTPEQTPGGPEFWFVEARGQGRGTTTGWAEGTGFRVMQMVSGVAFAGVSALRAAQITFHFTIDIDAGSEIAIEAPTNYILSCSTEGALQVGSLPGPGRPGCTDEPLVLMLASTLKRDVAYSFAVAVDLPVETPSPNTFNMIIRDSDNTVVDAVYGLAGMGIQVVPVTSPTLSWSRAEPAQKSDITIGITFTRDYNQVKALLITLPNTFLHEVMTPTQVQNLNRRFPVAASQAGGWAKTNDQDRIRIELDDSDDSTVIAADTYSWSFPVLVPANFAADIPRINVWYFSLCDARTCREPNGRDVIVSFPIQGFARGEVSPTGAKSPSDRAHVASLSFCTLLTVLAMCFCSA